MSTTRFKWWGYVKWCIRDYPNKCEELKVKQAQSVTPVYGGGGRGSDINRTTETHALACLSGQKEREYRAVKSAVEETKKYNNGSSRIKLIELVFWKKTHTLEGAALACYVSSATARAWHREFIRLTASYMGLLDS